MIKPPHLPAIWLAILLMMSCVDTLTYTVYHPAIPIPSSAETLLIIDNAQSDDSVHKNKKDQQANRLGRLLFVNELVEELSNDLRFHIVEDTTIKSADWSCTDLAPSRPADLFLVVRSFELDRSKGFTLSSEEANESYVTLYSKTVLDLYDSTCGLIENTRIDDQLKVSDGEWMPVIDLLDKEAIRHYKGEAKTLARSLARDYAGRWEPWQEEVTRMAYDGGKMKGFGDLIKSGKYAEAEQLLRPLLETEDYSLLAKAAYNMYILQEAQSKIDEAQEWLRQHQFYQNQTVATSQE